jgi:hypothetical protein
MEAARSYDLLSESWRSRRASVVVLAEAEMPKNQGAKGINFSLSTKDGELGAPMSEERRI